MKYIYCIIAILVQPIFLCMILKKQNKIKAAFRMPYMYISGLYLVVQLYVYIKYLRKTPENIANYVQIGILFLFILVEVLLLIANRYIKRIDKETRYITEEFRGIIRDIEIKKIEISDSEKLKHINQLIEELKYSDPSSAECVQHENMQLKELIQRLDSRRSVEEIAKTCNEASRILEIRNLKNKSGKKE